MVRHKIVRTLVVAASLVAMVIGSMPRAFLFADEFPPPSSIGPVASPQWDLTTLTVYDSNDASINVTVDSAGSPIISASVDQDASSGTFAFSMVSDDGFESMLVSGEVLADGSIYYQTVKANLAGATSSNHADGDTASVVLRCMFQECIKTKKAAGLKESLLT